MERNLIWTTCKYWRRPFISIYRSNIYTKIYNYKDSSFISSFIATSFVKGSLLLMMAVVLILSSFSTRYSWSYGAHISRVPQPLSYASITLRIHVCYIYLHTHHKNPSIPFLVNIPFIPWESVMGPRVP